MSVLNNNNIQQLPKSTMAANRLRMITKQTYDQMVQAFNQGVKVFWQNPNGVTPAQIASELGNDAKEIFELHHKLGQLIASVKPEDISESLTSIGSFTMNNDGTVTITEPETVE